MFGLLPDLLQAAQRTDFPLGDGHAHVVQWGVVIGASLAAALWDLRSRRIPNALTLPLVALGIFWKAWAGGMGGALDSVLGCLIVALPFVVLFLYVGGGAGDAKMMGAVGAWLGVAQGLIALVAVVVAGAVLGLAYAATKNKFHVVLRHVRAIAWIWVARIGARGSNQKIEIQPPSFGEELTEMPYALSILSGVCVAAIGAMLWHV